MDIAAMSMSLASTKLAMSVSTSVAKKAMESAEVTAAGLNKMLETVEQISPDIPVEQHIIDVKA